MPKSSPSIAEVELLSPRTIYLSSEDRIETAATIDGANILSDHDAIEAALRELSTIVGLPLIASRTYGPESGISEYLSHPSKTGGERVFSVHSHVGPEDFAGDEQDSMTTADGTEFLYFILIRDPEEDTLDASDYMDPADTDAVNMVPPLTHGPNRGVPRV